MMLIKKSGRSSVFRRFSVIAAVLVGLATASLAQDDGPTPGQVLKEAMMSLEAKNWDDAIDSMYMYVGMVEASKAPRVVAIAQDTRYKLATLLIQQDRLDEAGAVLQDYIDLPLANHPRQALKMLTTCYFETEAYEECASAVTNALYYNENPVIVVKQVVRGDDDEEEEVDYSNQEIEPEEEYSLTELTTLNMTLAESYFNLGRWEDCVAPFSFVIENTPNEQRKGYAIMQVINALIKEPAFDRITEWIPQLYRTSARFDIRVNLALMNAAAALVDAEEYDSALPLYRMILPRDQLIAYQEQKIRDTREAFGLPPEEGAAMTADELLLFGGDESDAASDETGGVADEEKPKELLELEQLLEALNNLPPYELDIKYRMADLYKTVERYWEALRFFDAVYEADPIEELGERCVYDMVEMLLESLGELEEAETRALGHIGKYKEGVTPRQLAYMLTGYYQANNSMETIKTLRPYIDEFVRTNDVIITKYDVELYFMQAVADLVLQNYEESEKSFKFVLDEFPDSHQEANATYWYAMTQLFLQKYVEAQPYFERYITKFPSEQYIDECAFQVGICMFGQEQYSAASNQFSFVIETYPKSSVYPEACSMRGDILGAEGLLDEAIVDYERAYAAHIRPNQATYATFQMAEIYEAEDKFEDIIRVVDRYRFDLKGDADIAKALFWIGKSKIQQKLYDEAVDTYVDAIIEYGGDLRQDGVDNMIAELVKISSIYLDGEQQDELSERLDSALEEAEKETLQLRLRVLIAKLSNTEHILGRQLLTELETLDNASPPVLATICDASFEEKDYSRSEELLRIFINKFEDSDYMRAAYKLRGFGQYQDEDYDGALATINDAQALYGTEPDVAWAQLLKARVLLDNGDIDAARDENMSVLTVPTWRGEPVAQATYQLGKVEEAAGNLEKAFAFYQRAYFQYKGHARGYWAVEGYLASAEILKKLGRENDVRNTYRALLFDRYVNDLPQAEVAREYLGASEVNEIVDYMETGGTTNITISVETELTPTSATRPAADKVETSSTEENA